MLALCGLALIPHAAFPQNLGIFEGQSDVGAVTPAGTAVYDPAADTYTLTSAGANLWGPVDAFHFVWKKISGDVSLTADIDFPNTTGEHNPHRKAILIVRQTLDANSAYADAAQHGSGEVALQDRRNSGDITEGIELNMGLSDAAPDRLRIEKRGDTFTMYLASAAGAPLHPSGASIQLHLEEPFYVGIGLCSHDANKVEKAVFSHVTLDKPEPLPSALALYSTLQTIGLEQDFHIAGIAFTTQGRFEAPNWTHDGKTLIFNQAGKIMTVPADGSTPPQPLDIGDATNCNGSHGLSPDGKSLAISCSTPGKPESRVYIVPLTGGTPRVVTEHPNSYWHSWSPDGRTIIFTRPDHGSGNIFAISIDGSGEHALTTGTGISDDPDCSPEGQWIYFNSDRGGSMQIWRMHPDGSSPEQITNDDYVNWTPHISPDGKSVVFISYEKGTTGHPANKPIALRVMSLDDRKTRVLFNLIGGAGTMNVPSWAPDSRHLAFVSYQMLPAQSSQ
jgi:Tol biopolymer transport system component